MSFCFEAPSRDADSLGSQYIQKYCTEGIDFIVFYYLTYLLGGVNAAHLPTIETLTLF